MAIEFPIKHVVVAVIAVMLFHCIFLLLCFTLLFQAAHNHMQYLLDVYFFAPDDIELNKKVLTWPRNINPIFDQNEEVCLWTYCKLQINLASNKNN